MSDLQKTFKWLGFPLFLFIFYEILWMLLDSTSGESDILPSALECVIDFTMCTVQILPCLYLIKSDRFKSGRYRFFLLSMRPHFLPLLLALLFVLNIGVAIPITFVETNLYEHIRKVNWTISEHILNDIVLAIVSTLLQTIYLLKKSIIELNTAKNQSIKAQKLMAESQLMALQSQINPHFLFNCLNTCVGLIDIDTTRAKDFIQNLSHVYRHILQNTDHYFVSIQEELSSLTYYTSLIETRYGKMVQIQIDKEMSNSHNYILRGVLQLLVENSIKHNKKKRREPLQVNIYSDGRFYIVENAYRPLSNDHASTRIGQENVKKQYETIGYDQVSFEITADKYIVHIPILHHEDIDHRR